MSEKTARQANPPRPRRDKVFGPGHGFALDRNAKARIMVYARAWSAKHRRPGQHRGPLTRAFMDAFKNSAPNLCLADTNRAQEEKPGEIGPEIGSEFVRQVIDPMANNAAGAVPAGATPEFPPPAQAASA